MSNLDYQTFLWINSFAGRSSVADHLGIFFAVYGIYVMMAASVLLAFSPKYMKNFFLAVATAVFSWFIVESIKVLVNRPRPFQVLHVHLLLQDFGSGLSFSSGHAVIMFAIAFSFYRTKWFWPMVVFAAISSTARIFVGVHYPSDVLASVAIAALVAWAMRSLFKKTKLS